MASKRTYTTPEVVFRPAFTLVGIATTLSLRAAREVQAIGNIAAELYMRRQEVEHRTGDTLVLFQRYPSNRRFDDLVPYTFTLGWMVEHTDSLPEGMVALTIPPGEYARFTHTGADHEIPATYSGIYGKALRGMRRWSAGYDYEVWDKFEPFRHRRSMVDIYVALQRRFPVRRSYLSDEAAIWEGYAGSASDQEPL